MNDDLHLLLRESGSPQPLLPAGSSETRTSVGRPFTQAELSTTGTLPVASATADPRPGRRAVPAPDTAPPPGPSSTARRSTARRALTAVLTLAIGLAWLVALRPLGLGGPASYVVVSGRSMEPTYRTGDLVITRSASTYDVGDIVAFRIPDDGGGSRPVVIHRIIGGDASGYLVQGDNNEAPDRWRPRPGDVLGRGWLALPRGGFILAAARSPLALAALAGVFAFLAALTTSPGARPRRHRSLSNNNV